MRSQCLINVQEDFVQLLLVAVEAAHRLDNLWQRRGGSESRRAREQIFERATVVAAQAPGLVPIRRWGPASAVATRASNKRAPVMALRTSWAKPPAICDSVAFAPAAAGSLRLPEGGGARQPGALAERRGARCRSKWPSARTGWSAARRGRR